VYDILSGYCVHTASVKAICANVGTQDEDPSCYFLRRRTPSDLVPHYRFLHKIAALIHLELVQSIPKDHLGDEDILPILFTTTTLGPYLSEAFSFEETMEMMGKIHEASSNGFQSPPQDGHN
jgi:hypothetical protein